jgi:hypothetical protein
LNTKNKKIPIAFEQDGATYRQLMRNTNWAVYRRTRDGYEDLVLMPITPEGKLCDLRSDDFTYQDVDEALWNLELMREVAY